DFSGADLYLDTITPLSYSQEGLYAQDSESRTADTQPVSPAAQTPAPTTAALASAPYASLVAARVSGSAVNVALSVGQSVYIGRQDGTVEVWNSGSSEKTVLAGLTPTATYTASTGGVPAGEGADKAFDGSTSTKYFNSSGAGSSVTIDLGGAYAVTGLGLTTGNDAEGRDPTSYQVKGSVDGKTFTDIASGSLSAPSDRETAYSNVTFANTTKYQYYQVVFPTVRTTGSAVQVSEIRLTGWPGSGQPPWGNNVSVTSLTQYNRVLHDQAGQHIASTFTGYIRGDELTVTGLGVGSTVQVGTEITAAGVAAGTIITAFVPKNVSQANCNTDKCTNGAAAGGVQGSTGTYKVSISQTVGESTSTPEVPAGIVFNQKTLSGEEIPASVPAIIVGLSNGSIQMYSPSVSPSGVGTGGWTELHGFQSGWGGVKAVMPYLDGFVVGLDNGYVRQWIGPTTNVGKGSDANDPSTWKNNWEILYRPGTSAPKYDGSNMSAFNSASAVTTMMSFRDRPDICPGGSGKGACSGFLVGRADGSVLKFNEGAGGVGQPGWQTLYDGSQNSPVVGIVEYKKLISGNTYLPSFAFALKNGYIGEWKWQPKDDSGTTQTGKYGVERIKAPGDWGGGNEIRSIAQLDRGFVVGLKNSSVQLRDASSNGWIELRNDGWSGGTGDNPVTSIIPFVSAGVTASGKQGVIVGLGNGSVQAWTGDTTGPNGSTWGQNNWIQLRGTDWQSKVTAIAPAVGNGINIYGDAVARNGVIVGFANGSVQKWSGVVTGGAPIGYISDGTQPAVFSGNISGTTLTVEAIQSGNIANGWYVVGGPADQTKITGFLTGTGGAGTYSVNQSQTVTSRSLIAGKSSGQTMVLSLPAAYLTNGGLDPASLVGATVTGVNVAAGTKITKYVGTAGLPAGQAKYEVSTYNLVGAEPLTISGMPNAGERDWTQLEAAPPTSAEGALGSVPSLADFKCDTNWKCSQGGTLQEAVTFGKTLAASGSPWQGSTSNFGKNAGVGSKSDPIFGNSGLSPYPDGGTTYTLAFSKEFSPAALSYTVGDPQSPTLKVGIDVNPMGYGYVVVPDGFFPKFKPGQWSLGVLVAAEIGPSLTMQGQVTAPEKDLSLASISTPGPLGSDSFTLSAGAKLGADVTLNGLPEGKSSVTAYAYAVPGMLFTYNTEGAQGEVQVAFNYYLDADASEFKALSGATANAYLTPYINLMYGIVMPQAIPLVGGWSLFSITGGFENPITASLCVDGSNSCPTANADTGAGASFTVGSSGSLTFSAGLLDGITSALTYEKKVPLYQIPNSTTVLV
ncbi:MAG: discoidin domain-containing protein, partial [Mycobacterium sp.]|nr:discoidin domain-containing protein [Mycobacterium sp.]